jgi:imidazolonepropionase-like amidohydrolase
MSVLVEGETIREVSPKAIKAPKADVIDCKGRTLMPGLIDCHVHVMLSEVNIRYLEAIPLTMMTVRAAALMRAMIDRGFTTVRDTGGADWGVRDGVAQGLSAGPRMFVAGRALGPTGGHSDAAAAHGRARARLPLLQRDEHSASKVVDGADARAQGRARAAAPRRRPDQDHGVGRGGEPVRSARQPPVHARGDRRRRRGGARVRPLHAGARLHARTPSAAR